MLHDLNSTLKEVNLVDYMYGYAGFEFSSLDSQNLLGLFLFQRKISVSYKFCANTIYFATTQN